jgi:hypothetical protein
LASPERFASPDESATKRWVTTQEEEEPEPEEPEPEAL